MKTINRAFLIFGITLLLFIACSLPPKPFIPDSKNKSNYQDAIRYSRQYLEQYMKKNKIVGMAVAVIDSNRIVYSEGFGYADKIRNIKVSDSTTFMIASITKLFTATAIMQLVEQGTVVLDSPITTYLPEFTIKSRFSARPITVRDLLTHESGLPTDVANGFYLGQRAYPGADTMYRTAISILSNEYVTTPPMTVGSYSNIGFSLLGNIIERVSRRNYSDYIQDSIFTRLGMNHSAVGFEQERVKSLFSKGYADNKEIAPFYIRDLPAGGIVSNVKDLSLFAKMVFSRGTLDNRHILNENTLCEMWTPQNGGVLLDFDRPVGLGYYLSNIPIKTVGHDGFIPPYHSCFLAFPDVRLGVIVLINSAPADPHDPTMRLLETFYEAKIGNKLPKPTKVKTQPVIKLSKERLQELAGSYQTFEGTTKAQVKGDELVFPFKGKNVSLVPHSDSTFSVQYKLFGLIPVSRKHLQEFTFETHTVNDSKIILVRSNGKIQYVCEKFEPEVPPKKWIARAGTYEVVNEKKPKFANDENEKEWKLSSCILSYNAADKNLCLNGESISAISSDEAVTRGVGFHAGETIRAYKENGQEFLWVSGYALRKQSVPNK